MKLLTTITLAAGMGALAADPLPIIPQPVKVETAAGTFVFSAETAIRHHRDLAADAKLFADDLGKLTGQPARTYAKELKIHLASEILLDLDPTLDVPASGYRLTITPQAVKVVGKDAAGAYYGTRSILQLLPAGKLENGKAEIPAATVTDYPRFGWRGMHLDVGRHFYPAEDVKRFIDWLAFHKLNVLHWHLTEDQGWRIEIKKYPKLTTVGGFRDSTPPYGNRNSDDGVRYGGFYTQDQIREIVAYAKARHITVVPEIELPGHAAAAITAYPELGNDDIPGYAPKVMTRWGVHPYVFAPTEKVFGFIDDVLTEVCALFPSPYIHIGGDEAPKDQWDKSPRVRELMKKENLKNGHDVQSYFIKRVEKILESKGRKLIGWDEIREGGLSPKATVMSWRGEQGGIDSAKEGHDVVMAPNSHTYFDHYQAPEKSELAKGKEFEAIGGLLPIEKVYSYDPVPKALSPAEAKHVLGVQAQLWSEYFKTFKKVEYHAFPRIAALAEVAWTPLAAKNYENFRQRLTGVLKHYDAAGINRGELFVPPVRKTKDGSTVETSIGTYQDHWPELAFDGSPDTFFWADRELRAGDHFTLHLKAATAAETSVSITTGGPAGKNGDRLESGVLEASANGSAWTKVADFKDGVAEGKVPAGTAHLRIKVTAPQKNWLIIHEIRI
ncbi:MAG: family 20 glycosylhydrolase [Verrucomicrobia bacterium]|nr:family 20 glycosylhydrolase [Verrucomicrobiota bacterium]